MLFAARADAMVGREYYLKQAATCLRLANSLTDGEVAKRLREMAAEFQQKARDAENGLDKDREK
jgi:hypothetical protein